MSRLFVNIFEKPTSSQAFMKFEDDLRELLPKLSSTVGRIIAVGKKILEIENDRDFCTLKRVIDEKPKAEQRLKMVVLIVLYCAYQVLNYMFCACAVYASHQFSCND